MNKTCFALCKNKCADQLHINGAADQRLCFCHIDILNDTSNATDSFLAHLSRRLIGELIVYQWSGVRPLSTMLKHLLLRNRLANQSQILCAASLDRWNESLFKASRSHDQDGHHIHIW